MCAFSSGFRTAPLGAGADLGVGTRPPGWAWGLLLCHYEGPRTTHRPRGPILRRFRVRLTGSLPRRRGRLHLRRPGLPRAQAWRPESSAHPCGWRARIARALSLAVALAGSSCWGYTPGGISFRLELPPGALSSDRAISRRKPQPDTRVTVAATALGAVALPSPAVSGRASVGCPTGSGVTALRWSQAERPAYGALRRNPCRLHRMPRPNAA